MKRIISILISLVIIVSIPVTSMAYNINWYDNAIEELDNLDVLNSNTYKEDEYTSVSSFISNLIKCVGISKDAENIYEYSTQLGLIDPTNYTIDTINNIITRVEAAQIIYNANNIFNLNINKKYKINLHEQFIDYKDILDKYYNAVEYAVSTGIIVGNNYKFGPNNKLLNYETAVILSRLINKNNRVDIKVTDLSNLLSEFSTSTNGKDHDRDFNVAKAAESLNNTIIWPNEIFSYYKTIGRPNKEAGYKQANVISGGKYVKGYGGGVCQDATTLFNAALLANLNIVERRAHGLKSTYVKPGYDATFSSGNIDLKIQNNYLNPILIKANFDTDTHILTVKLYGDKNEIVPSVNLYTKGSGNSWTLYREVDGEVNYKTSSYYKG